MSDALDKLAERLPEVAALLPYLTDKDIITRTTQWFISGMAEAALTACAREMEQADEDTFKDVFNSKELRQRAEQAEAELAAMKARRCETCAKWLEVPSPVNSDLRMCDSWSGETGSSPPVYTSADVGCSFWEEKT